MKNATFRVLAFGAFCLLLAGSAWYFSHWLEKLPDRLWAQGRLNLEVEAARLRARFMELANFQPRIRINDRVIFEQTSPIAELALISRPTTVEHDFVHTWAGSTKRLHLSGKFLVKSGIDLNEQVEIEIQQNGARISLPSAKILSAELIKLDLQTENGWWNQITDAEQQQAIAELRTRAMEQSASLNREAEKNFRQQLAKVMGKNVTIVIRQPEASAPAQVPIR